MKNFTKLLLVFALIWGGMSFSAFADNADPLFINLTTNDAHRANMGITFGKGQLERGHPLTIFLNDKGVLLASKANSAEFAEHQKMLSALIEKGATVLICRMCMNHFEVLETDLLPGIKVSSPEISGNALFQDDTKTMSW